MSKVASSGVLYAATGERFVREAEISARSVKRHMPELPVLLWTDVPEKAPKIFDEVKRIESPRYFFADKVGPMLESPFEKTLFLDTDTYVCEPVWDLFELLERFDIALAHAPMRHDREYPTPNCFSEMNSGVMVYRRNDRVARVLKRWVELYEGAMEKDPNADKGDQVYIRQALYESDAVLYILPPEYNYRSVMPSALPRRTVKIIHGRADDMDALARRLNRSTRMRVTLPAIEYLRDVETLDVPGGVLTRGVQAVVSGLLGVRKLFGGKNSG